MPTDLPLEAVEIHAEYDAEANILEVWIGPEPRAAISFESPDGTLVRHAIDDDKVCGFTIFDWETPTSTRCVCDGRYDGCEHGRRCGEDVTDDRWGPWCSECHPRRFAHIDANFKTITDSFKASS